MRIIIKKLNVYYKGKVRDGWPK